MASRRCDGIGVDRPGQGAPVAQSVTPLLEDLTQPVALEASPLGTLSWAFTRLTSDGRLTLCIESNALGDPSDLARSVGYVRSIAQRCGFEPGPIPYADASCPKDCVPLRFERMPRQPRWCLAHLTPDALDAFCALFQTVFGETMGPPLWHWKYGDDRGCSVAAYRDGRLVAHYGGSRRAVAIFGRMATAVQICDAMVDPAERAVMTKTGAMYQVTATFLEIYQGLAGIPLAFGFPSRRAMGLGERLGLYAEVGALCEVRWGALHDRPRLLTRVRYLNPHDAGDRQSVDRLWVAMLRDLTDAVAVIRDWAYLCYRYAEHPERHYEILLVSSRVTSRPLGVLVLRIEDGAVELLDLVAPLKHIPLLIDQARRLAGRWGKQTLYCWITRQHAARFGGTPGARITELDIRIPTNAWVHQDLTPAQLYDRWWLTSGDTDFH